MLTLANEGTDASPVMADLGEYWVSGVDSAMSRGQPQYMSATPIPPPPTIRNRWRVWPPQSIAELRREWFENAVLPIDFTPTGEEAPQGERGGMWVMSPSFPSRQAYLKPRKDADGGFMATAAREKIASDLAYLVDAPVPPAVLVQRARNCPPDEPRLVVLSMRVYPVQLEWAAVRLFLRGSVGMRRFSFRDLAIAAARGASRAWPFDLWVGQFDHGDDNRSNIVLGIEDHTSTQPKDFGFVFFDYEKALGIAQAWPDMPKERIPFASELMDLLDREVVDETVQLIEEITDKQLQEIVCRIPRPYIKDEDRGQIIAQLIERRGRVRAAVAYQLGRSP